MKEYNSRRDVPDKYKWDLKEFFISDEEWENDYIKINNDIPKLIHYKGKINESNKLEEYLNLYIDIRCRLLNLFVYAYLNKDVDLSNSKYIEMYNKISSTYTTFNNNIAFFEPELLSISKDNYNKLFSENNNLEKYRKFLDEIFKKKEHKLSEKEEMIINSLTDTFNSYENIASSLLNSENNYGSITMSDGNTVNILPSSFRKIKRDRDENIRKRANRKFYKVIKQYENTEASLLNNFVKNNIALSKLHNYNSTWEEVVHNENLDNEVFNSLQNACNKRLDVNKKFYKLMKKVLNLNTLHSYDTSLKWNESEKEYKIEEAQNIVLSSLSILGEEYKSKLKNIFDKNYIDYCTYKGKASGGYSYSTYDKNPKILMNYRGMFDDISIIAHESGHNVHHQFLMENNHSWYVNQIRIVSEVTSLTNEFLLAHYMVNNGKTKDEKLIGLENIIKVFQSNFYGAIMEGELEVKMYNKVLDGGVITADYLNNEMDNLLKKYQGKCVSRGSYTKLMWALRSHYYMVYYLFSYAISVSIASNIADRIIKGESGILDKYYKFLKTGTDINPIDTFKILDIDIKSEKVYLDGIEYFNKQLDNYEKILKGGSMCE